MASNPSRRKIAEVTAEALVAGDSQAMPRLAAYLVDTRRTAEAELIVRDIELELADQGIVLADITTARELAEVSRGEITEFVQSQGGARKVILREHVDPSVIGGMHLAFGDKVLDATVAAKLERLT
jgi:F-type H+-transporting ATPase subunit delta